MVFIKMGQLNKLVLRPKSTTNIKLLNQRVCMPQVQTYKYTRSAQVKLFFFAQSRGREN